MNNIEAVRFLLYTEPIHYEQLEEVVSEDSLAADYALSLLEGKYSPYPEHRLWRCILQDYDVDSNIFTPDLGKDRLEKGGKVLGWLSRILAWWISDTSDAWFPSRFSVEEETEALCYSNGEIVWVFEVITGFYGIDFSGYVFPKCVNISSYVFLNCNLENVKVWENRDRNIKKDFTLCVHFTELEDIDNNKIKNRLQAINAPL